MAQPDDLGRYPWWWLQWKRGERCVEHLNFMVSHQPSSTAMGWPRMGFPKTLYPTDDSLPRRRLLIPIWPDLKR